MDTNTRTQLSCDPAHPRTKEALTRRIVTTAMDYNILPLSSLILLGWSYASSRLVGDNEGAMLQMSRGLLGTSSAPGRRM